jgi:ribonuclease Z
VRRTFQLSLPNGLFGDPLVVARPRLVPRVLLFDAGDTAALTPRTLLGVTDVLVSHCHVDHVFGLGRLLRVRLGRSERSLRISGPPGLVARVRSHLDSYTWNLVEAYPLDLRVVEVHPDRTETWRFPIDVGFAPVLERADPPALDGPVWSDELLEVRAVALDHAGIPSLAWRVQEHRALNIDAERLAARGLPAGPWLSDLKTSLRKGLGADTPVALPGSGFAALGELADDLVREAPGDSLAYVTDIRPSPEAIATIAEFARGVRRLILESHFLETDAALAHQHGHLTAASAGEIARRAGAVALSPVHLSTRYQDRADELLAELGAAASPTPVEQLATGALNEDW